MAVIKPIQYKVPTETATASGGKRIEYALDPNKDFAEVRNLKDRMEVAAAQQVDGVLIEFRIRHRPSLAITDQWLIVYEGKDFKITAIEPQQERNFYYKVTAKHIG